MSSPDLSAESLLAWNHATAQGWYALANEQPSLLALPCDIHNSTSAGQLLHHIVSAELRYAERLIDAPASDYATIPHSTADDIFSTHDRAMGIFHNLLANPAFDWDREIEFPTLTAGRRRAKRSSVFQHALLHSIRHYAQLATLARQHGMRPRPMDILLMLSTSLPE
ncbi:MAG TPA: DinB family protein [Edaphobacter sp.]